MGRHLSPAACVGSCVVAVVCPSPVLCVHNRAVNEHSWSFTVKTSVPIAKLFFLVGPFPRTGKLCEGSFTTLVHNMNTLFISFYLVCVRHLSENNQWLIMSPLRIIIQRQTHQHRIIQGQGECGVLASYSAGDTHTFVILWEEEHFVSR